MKLTALLAALGVCLFAAPALASRSFLNAFDLQQICMQQRDVDNTLNAAQCKGYVEGVVDTAYQLSGCTITMSTLAVVTPLAEFFNSTPDETLKQIPASGAVFVMLSTRTAAVACFDSGTTGFSPTMPPEQAL